MRCGVWAVASGRAVEVIELAINRGGLVGQLFRRSAGVFGFTTRELNIALLRCLLEDVLSLLDGDGMPEPVAVGGAHVVHADCRDGFDARIDLGRADDEATAAANPDRADPLLVDK